MATRRRSVKHTRRRRRNSKLSRHKQIYIKKNKKISERKNKKRRINKLTHKVGYLYHIGGAKGINDPMDDMTIDEVESFLDTSSLVPEGQSSQEMLDGIIEDVNEERREQGLASLVRPTKLSLFGKLFEYIFARKELHLDGKDYSDFVNTKGDEKYDVHVKYTQGKSVPQVYKNCFLSLKTKKILSQTSVAFAGYVETGKAMVLLDSLKDVLLKKHGQAKFKMVVESYYPVELERKVVAIRGIHRHVYNITDSIGIILGRYNSKEEIQKLLDKAKEFTQEGQEILDSRVYTLDVRGRLLDQLKEKVNRFNEEISRNLGRDSDGCLVRVDIKESKECRTFVHSTDPRVRTKIPQYRVASSLDVGRLEYNNVDPGSPILTTSPRRSESKKQLLPLQKGWSEALSHEPIGRSGRSAEETERLLERFYSSTSRLVSDRSERPSERTESRRPRSRSTTPGRAQTPKSSGRRKTAHEIQEEKSKIEEINRQKKQKDNQERENRRLIREQQQASFYPSFPASFAAPNSAASFAAPNSAASFAVPNSAASFAVPNSAASFAAPNSAASFAAFP
jgi:hypothetical protein